MIATDTDVTARHDAAFPFHAGAFEARLGPHAYRIPAHCFRDQSGPDVDGSACLLLQWPALEPLPPGVRRTRDLETFDRQVLVAPFHRGRAIDGWLERSVRPPATDDLADPRAHLDLRLERPPVFGLVPWEVDRRRMAGYDHARSLRDGHPHRSRPETFATWYLARDASGALATVVKCDAHEIPDGLAVDGACVRTEGAWQVARCAHEFVVAADGIGVTMAYARAFLHDWKRIEGRVRALLARWRLR